MGYPGAVTVVTAGALVVTRLLFMKAKNYIPTTKSNKIHFS